MQTTEINPVIAKLGHRLRLGVVGGGPSSFIGEIHRSAARLDDRYEVVASVLSSNPERSRAAGRAIGIAEGRAYGAFEEMVEQEGKRDDGIEVLAVMTPNGEHYAACCTALERGMDVICDKPLTTKLEDSLDLVRRVRDSGLVFCTTYNYTGYPMVRQARAMVAAGELGEIRLVHLEYVQGHLATLVEQTAAKKNAWRFDAQQAGDSLIVGDIGVHSHHLGAYVSGLEPASLCADVGAVVPEREADDYAGFLLRYENGARGVMWLTQAAAGAEHGLRIRVHGEKGGLDWCQEHPNHMRFMPLGRPAQMMSRGGPGLHREADRCIRVSIGHPEGYHEGFANLYSDAAEAIAARRTGTDPDPLAMDFPTVEDGARGVKFIDAAVESSRAGSAWVDCALDVQDRKRRKP